MIGTPLPEGRMLLVLGPLIIRGEDRRSLLAFGRRRILHSEHLLGGLGLRANDVL